MAIQFEALRGDYKALWADLSNRPDWIGKIERAAQGIIVQKARYRTVEDLTGVPWFVVALIHHMESGGNFKTHLHNGDPLLARTANIPFGRPSSGNPPFTWEESAADAVRHSALDQVPEWSCERVCFELEKYNGFRSRVQHHINTPYLWSGTTHYERGKFVRDNVWDPSAVSQQVGAMPILRRLIDIDPSIGEQLKTGGPTRPATIETSGTLDLEELQKRLKQQPLYGAEIDGIYGSNTRRAIQAFLVTQQVTGWQTWPRDRLIVAGKQALCRLDGIDVGEIDGIEGPQTQYALSVYAARRRGEPLIETWRDREDEKPPLTTPPPAAAVWPRQRDVASKFGEVGQNQTRLVFPYPMRLAWDMSTTVKSTSCHEKVHDATERILKRVLSHYGIDRIRELRLDLFGGCINIRRMRGGSAWSMHAWGIAFDFDPERNQLRWGQDRAAFARPEYQKWFDLWEEEGAVSLGRARNFDWMHLQFARV